MSKIKCNKCGADIKIKTIFLERAGCESCGNSIDFTNMDALSGLKQGLMLATSVFVFAVLFVVMLIADIQLTQLPEIFASLSVEAFGLLIIAACVIVLVVGTLEKIIGCRIYEKVRIREEELERIAAQKRAEDAAKEKEE